jgi:hypothetical protein
MPLRAPSGSTVYVAPLLSWPFNETLLDLGVDFVEPSFRALGSFLITLCFYLQLRDPVFGRAKLTGKLLRHFEGMLTICFGHAGGLLKQPQDGLPCFIELIGAL